MGKKKKKQSFRNFEIPIVEFLHFLTQLCHVIGIPGVVVIYAIYYLQFNTSSEQKEEFFDYCILLKNNSNCTSFVFGFILFFVFVFIAQQYFYKKQRKIDLDEIKRLAEFKTKHQEKKTGTNLHHSEN